MYMKFVYTSNNTTTNPGNSYWAFGRLKSNSKVSAFRKLKWPSGIENILQIAGQISDL